VPRDHRADVRRARHGIARPEAQAAVARRRAAREHGLGLALGLGDAPADRAAFDGDRHRAQNPADAVDEARAPARRVGAPSGQSLSRGLFALRLTPGIAPAGAVIGLLPGGTPGLPAGLRDRADPRLHRR
jgi:pyruvate/2-oxoglutarate dehydrogenase complex dihydrolipoamide acyltransferase (E2) component